MVACSPFGPAGELAASCHGALTRSQAADHGLSATVVRRLLRNRVLTEPAPGVLVVVGSPPTWRQRMYVATLASNAAGAAGFRSAAALHRMDGYEPGPLELLVPGTRHVALAGLVMHRGPFDATDLIEIEGIRCTSIARTLCDLGAVDERARVKAALEWAWRTEVSLRWIRSTAVRLDLPQRPGPRPLLSLLDEAEAHSRPTESALEARLDDVLATEPGVVRQFVVTRADGSFVARVDFAIPALKIAIEAHSRRHHFGPGAEESDARREAELHADGWIVRFVTDAQRRHPEQVRDSLRRLVAARLRTAA